MHITTKIKFIDKKGWESIWREPVLCSAAKPRWSCSSIHYWGRFYWKRYSSDGFVDNIFAGHELNRRLKVAVNNAESGKGATVFGYYVDDPERFGIVEFDSNGKAFSIEEQPEYSKSNYSVTGLYFCDNRVVECANALKSFARGEMKTTDLNQISPNNGKSNTE